MTQQSHLSPEIRDIWTDIYKFHATFEHMGNSVEEWKQCADVLVKISNKHHNHPLIQKLLIVVYEYLEDQRRPMALKEAERRSEAFDKAD